jgi:hypothetical protein
MAFVSPFLDKTSRCYGVDSACDVRQVARLMNHMRRLAFFEISQTISLY